MTIFALDDFMASPLCSDVSNLMRNFGRWPRRPGERARRGEPVRRIVIDETFSEAHVASAVDATDGFSGREISKLAIAWQAAVPQQLRAPPHQHPPSRRLI